MIRRIVAVAVTLLMATNLFARAEEVVVKTDWTGLQEQVARQKLKNRGVRISLVSGGEIKTVALRVERDGVVVRLNGATKQWASGKEEALIPRESVSSIRFGGKIGRGGLIGGLIGLGAAAAVGAASAAACSGGECEGSAGGVAVIVVIPLFALVGWLVGRSTEKPAPTFILTP